MENAGAPQKLEWVTPKISLMEAGDADGSQKASRGNENWFVVGPS
jgi:hypothetical protein